MGFNIFDDVIGAPLDMLGISGSQLPVIGGMFTDPAEEAAQQKLREISAEYKRMRPIYNQAMGQSLQQQLGAYGPANQMLGQMHGMAPGQGVVDLQALGQNPLPSSAFEQLPPPGAPPQSPGDVVGDYAGNEAAAAAANMSFLGIPSLIKGIGDLF